MSIEKLDEKTSTELKALTTSFIDSAMDDDSGFSMYVLMKNGPAIMKLMYFKDNRGGSNPFRDAIRSGIQSAVRKKYEADDSQYAGVKDIANEQKRIFMIPENDAYFPFRILKMVDDHPFTDTGITGFKESDIDNAKGFLFRFEKQYNNGNKVLWAYQQIYAEQITKKERATGFLDDGDVFRELKGRALSIKEKVDLIIFEDTIATGDIKLLQKSFSFEVFINAVAQQAIKSVEDVDIITNSGILYEYLSRSGGDKKYARKMMRIRDSKVLRMATTDLHKKIEEVDRWKGKFSFDGDRIKLNTYKDVELFIDLLDERYTVSLITNEEYDTDVKEPAEQDAGKSERVSTDE